VSYNFEREELSRLRDLVAEIVETVGHAGDDQAAAITAIRDKLATAGLHPGQTDADGRLVLPPHHWTCQWCHTAEAER